MGWWEAVHHGVSGPAALALIIYTLLALGWAPLQIQLAADMRMAVHAAGNSSE